MKSYTVVLEVEEFIEVEAENQEEALRRAVDIANTTFEHAWNGCVINEREAEKK